MAGMKDLTPLVTLLLTVSPPQSDPVQTVRGGQTCGLPGSRRETELGWGTWSGPAAWLQSKKEKENKGRETEAGKLGHAQQAPLTSPKGTTCGP